MTTGDQSDWLPLYPFESRFLRVRGGRYHYLDEGRGPPLLLVHGNPTWSFYWRNLVLGLRDRHRVIVPDHLGCGLSDKPADFDYRLASHVANLRRLVRELDLREATLVAHDWGGAIGMGAAVAEPDRFARLVLMNTAAFRAPWMPWRIRVCRTPLLGRLAIQGANAFARAALTMAAERPLSAPVKAGLIAPYDSWSNRRATYEFVQDIPMNQRHPSYETLLSIEQGLGQFRDRPVLLPWGLRDWCFTPRFLERFKEIFPQAEARPIADAGHYIVEDAPEELIGLIGDFLDRHPVGAHLHQAAR